MDKQTVTVGFDARLSGVRHAGLGRYIKSLAVCLPLLAPEAWQLVYFVADKTQWSEIVAELATLDWSGARPAGGDVLLRVKLVVAPQRHYSLAEQTQLPALIRAEKLDLLHVPHFNVPYLARPRRLVVTIHDLLWHEKKGLQVTTLSPGAYLAKYAAYRLLVKKVVAASQTIITPSQTIKQTVARYYPRAAAKTEVIPNGVTDFARVPAQPVKKPLPENFWLYVGSLYPHKNVSLVLQALQKKRDLNLVIVSARDAFWEKTVAEIHARQVGAQVFFLGSVSDQQLKYLYERAEALIQPSLSEGFGLTGVEAASVGTPILASDIPIFREIYGELFGAFDPTSVESLLAARERLVKETGSELSHRLRAHARTYTWTACAQQVVDVYRRVLEADG